MDMMKNMDPGMMKSMSKMMGREVSTQRLQHSTSSVPPSPTRPRLEPPCGKIDEKQMAQMQTAMVP